MATHASALKAHRQSLVHRERNRKFRSQLRTTLKQIRLVIEAKDNAAAKKQLSAAVSVIDKMATKGVIHRNTASRYKSRLSARVVKHSSTTSRSSKPRGSPADVLMARSVRKTASTAAVTLGAGTFVRTNQASWPRII